MEENKSKEQETTEIFVTSSGIPIKLSYHPDDVEIRDYKKSLGDAGQFPYTRGIYSSMYRGRKWTMRQYAGFGTPEESNKRFKYLLQQGQTGLSVAFDLPTQLGLDSDDSRAIGEVGKVGVAIDTVEDLRILFEDIPLDQTSVSFTINATAPIILAMYIVVAEDQGLTVSNLRGTLQNDILKEYLARGTWIFPTTPSMRLAIDVIEYCTNHLPKFYPISICGYHIRESGANAVQELAITLANAIEYIKSALDRGLSIDDFAPRLSFFMCVSNDLFEEVAKFRASRRLWSHIMRNQFQAKNPKSWLFRMGASCGGSTLTAEEPENNVVRLAYETLAAALGGVQSLFTCGWDEPFSIPTQESAKLALRSQQVLAYETGVANIVDPLGGSYYVENLTNEIEVNVTNLLQNFESRGGITALIERGIIQQLIQESAYRQQHEIEEGKRKRVGLNIFKTSEPPRKRSVYKLDENAINQQILRTKKVKETRDNNAVSSALLQLREHTLSDHNILPRLIRAARCKATVGEMTNVLQNVFGEYREPTII